MQLKKHNWKKARNSARFTEPDPTHGFQYRSRRGGWKTESEMLDQARSRETNPEDPNCTFV